MRNLVYSCLLVILNLTWAGVGLAQSAQPDAGVVGGACMAGDTPCWVGVCDTSLGGSGMCVPCGMPGEAACLSPDGALSCHLAGMGFAPISSAEGMPICATSDSTDCGEVGLTACLRDGQPYCYRGALVHRDGEAYCASCGDIGQACCLDTKYQCDYGSCQGGICLGQVTAGRDQIIALIDDCRLSEARGLIDALPAGTSYLDADQPALDAADKRENEVRTLFAAAKDIARAAKADYTAEDYGNAEQKFRNALAELQKARALTRCPRTRLVLDEGLAVTQRNIDRSQTNVSFATVEQAIKICEFGLAHAALDQIAATDPRRAVLAQRLDEVEGTEKRVLGIYNEARALNSKGKRQLENGDFATASANFAAARDLFTRTRQLTNCLSTRNTIDDALAAVGRNIIRVDIFRADQDQEGVYDNLGVDLYDLDGAHPCLDSSVPVDNYVAGYKRYFGGGTTSSPMKGRYICGYGGAFSILSQSALVAYRCDRNGDRYENCREVKRQTVDSQVTGADGIVTHVLDGGDYWIVVLPPK